MPSIIEQQDQIMGLPMEVLVNYAQNPSGALPLYLVLERISDLTGQKKKHLASQNQRPGTIFDQSIEEASAPQGIGALQPQMPPGASGGAMPPSNAMQQPPMPPEMISAQMNAQSQMLAATGGRMPYPAMAGGGVVPPNSLVEDASKFNPQSMYDMDPSQMAMANPTNMGIASVLPMSGGGVVRMQEGEQVPDSEGWYPDWARDYVFNPSSPLDWAMVGGTAYLGGVPGFVANVGRKSLVRGATNLGRHGIRRLNKLKKMPFRDEKGRFSSYETGIGMLRGASNYINPLKGEFWKKSVPVAGIGASVGHKAGMAFRDLIRSAEASEAENNNEPVLATKDELENFLFPNNALYQGGLVKMQAGTTVPFLSIDDVRASLEEKYMKPPEWLDDVEGGVLSQEEANLLRDYTSQVQEIDTTLLPERRSPFREEDPLSNEIVPIDLETALEAGRAEGELNLTPYEISQAVDQMDVGTTESEMRTRIDALEEMKGQTPETFDITESVLRSGERADKRAMSQALINLGAGIAAGDISQGFKDAGTAVSGIRQRQEEFQQLADIRRAEAESKASSDRITRDIGIISSEIDAYGDINEQRRAANLLLIEKEKLLGSAYESGNELRIAQATNEVNIAKIGIQISQFKQTLEASIDESSAKDERARVRLEQAAITSLGPAALLEGSMMDEGEKARWIPKNLPDKTPGWSGSRALRDVLAGYFQGQIYTPDDVSEFSLVGPGQ